MYIAKKELSLQYRLTHTHPFISYKLMAKLQNTKTKISIIAHIDFLCLQNCVINFEKNSDNQPRIRKVTDNF